MPKPICRAKSPAPHRALEPHDHAACVSDALDAATGIVAARGLKLTPLRQRVLEIVCASHRPVGAYDVLEKLSAERAGTGERAAPPTVYRALEFLLEAGLVHRIDSLNAFVACFAPGRAHRGYFLICEACRSAEELQDEALSHRVSELASRANFTVRREVVEIIGLCASCAAAQEGSPVRR